MLPQTRILPLLVSASLVLGLIPMSPTVVLAEEAAPEVALAASEGELSAESNDEVLPVPDGSDQESSGVEEYAVDEVDADDGEAPLAGDTAVNEVMNTEDAEDADDAAQDLTADDQMTPDEHAVIYAPGYEGNHASSTPSDLDLMLFAQAEQKSFPDMPIENCIWPVEGDAGIAYLVKNDSGKKDIRKYDLQTGEVSILLGDILTDGEGCFARGDYLYFIKGRNSSEATICKLSLASGESEELFSVGGDFYYGSTRLGVDANENIYLYNGTLYIFNRSGESLCEAEVPNLESFVGFDDTNGNFYYEGYYNWVYWGYDHSMRALKVGNFDGANVVYNDNPITILFQNYFYTHYGCAEMLPGGYLADLSTFSGEQLAILDSHLIDQADVTDTTTSISLIDSGVTVTSVALPEDTVVFGAETRRSTYEDDVDISSVGSRCAYLEGSDLLAVATDSNQVTCYTLHGGAVQGVATTSGDIYKVMAVGNEIVLLEGTAYTGLVLERLAMNKASSITIDGPDSCEAGGSADYTAILDSDLVPPSSFSSSDPEVLSIDDAGHAAAWKVGTVTITVSTETGLTASKTVEVIGASTPKTRPDVATASGAAVDNWNLNDYSTYGSIISSYIVETASGLMRVQARVNDVLVEYYDRSGKLTASKAIAFELPLFGGFYAGSDSYYLVFGQDNPGESDDLAVMRVVRYDSSWRKIAACDISAINTRTPFDAGSLRMVETNGLLYIHTCHLMYESSDGLNHQANMTFVVNESDMTLADFYADTMNLSYGYVSHSFNQFIQTDGTYVYRVDHGDEYPRGITFTATPVGGAVNDPWAYGILQEYANDYGYGNYTGASIGGFEVSDTSVLVAYNEDVSPDETIRNIKITSYALDGLRDPVCKEVTSYGEDSTVTALTPQLVKLDARHLLLMWAETDVRTGAYWARFVKIDQGGNPVGTIVKKMLPLSDCQPIKLSDGSVGWFVSSDSETKLYTLNPYDLASMSEDDFSGRLAVDISQGQILAIPTQTYSGQALTPKVTVKLSGSTLGVGGDYDVTFANNVKPGTATVTVTGKGGYKGTLTRRFQISWPFTDVNAKTPHADDVLWLHDTGISTGWKVSGSREFRPTNTVIRQDMAAFLFRLAKSWGLVDDSWQPSGTVTFTDVSARTPHYREIMWLAESGVSAGWKVGSGREFRPTNTVVRQDMAAFLRRLQALRDPSVRDWQPTGASPFRDVTARTPHYDDILWLAESGVSAGWKVSGGKEFRPTSTVIRQDMAAFLHRLDGLG